MKLNQFSQGIILVCLLMSLTLVPAYAGDSALGQAKPEEGVATDGKNMSEDNPNGLDAEGFGLKVPVTGADPPGEPVPPDIASPEGSPEGIKSTIQETTIETSEKTRWKSSNPATQVQAVVASPKNNAVVILAEGNGRIVDYDYFTLKGGDDKPARIIFDLFNVTSPFHKEEVIAVDSPIVDKVRHIGYADRFRIVIETREEYLSACETLAVENGLEIRVGEQPSDQAAAGETEDPEVLSAPAGNAVSAVSTEAGSSVSNDLGGQKPEAHADLKSAANPPVPTVPGETLETLRDNHLKDLEVTALEGGLVLKLHSEKPVEDLRSFTIPKTPDHAARIVFDIPRLKSFTKKMEVIPVNSDYAESVRHLEHPEHLRLVIDTDEIYLKSYSTNPVAEGIEIIIGNPKREAYAEDKTQHPEDPAPAPGDAGKNQPEPEMENILASMQLYQESIAGTPAWVNKVDFFQTTEGKSTVSIGLTRPSEYKIQQAGAKQLNLEIYNVRIPEERKRPLITTRFDSALDRIIPVQKPSMKNNAVVVFELREMVPYKVEQKDTVLEIHFEASSVPPKPFEHAQLPEWKRVVAESELTGKTIETSPGEPPAVTKPETLEETEEDFDDPPYPSSTKYKAYSGEKIALDFYETDIKNVFRILREVSGKNFAIDKDVTGTVTMTLDKPVPWDQILELILKMNQLDKVQEGDIVRIAKISTLTKEERERQANVAAIKQAQEQAKELEPLSTEYLPISYSNAKTEILPHVQLIVTKDRSSLSVDERTNMVIITDTAEKIQQAKQIVKRLDKVTPQVMIEARIVEAQTEFARDLGIKWNFDYGIDNSDPKAGYGPQRGYDTLGGTWGFNGAVDLPLPRSGVIGFEFTRINGTPLSIDAQLGAMEMSGKGKIISAPKILTLDNKKAKIKQGNEVPYQAIDDDGTANVQFKEVDLLLEVTPHVTPDERISLRVFITKNEVIGTDTASGVPVIGTKEAETELLIDDGETIVIGGILKRSELDGDEGIPGLRKLPVLSWVFNAKTSKREKEELLIFLTPRIVQLAQRGFTDS